MIEGRLFEWFFSRVGGIILTLAVVAAVIWLYWHDHLGWAIGVIFAGILLLGLCTWLEELYRKWVRKA